MASSEGDQPLAKTFHAIIDKIKADILQNLKSGIGNESNEMNWKELEMK